MIRNGWDERGCTATAQQPPPRMRKEKKSPAEESTVWVGSTTGCGFFLPSSIVHSLPSFPFFLPFLSSFRVSFFFSRRINANVCAFLLSSWVVTNKDAQFNYGGWINMNERTQSANTEDKRKKYNTQHTPPSHIIPRETRCSKVCMLSLSLWLPFL